MAKSKKKAVAILLTISAVLLGSVFFTDGEDSQDQEPTLRELAQTEDGWDTSYMSRAAVHTQPPGITVVYGESTDTVVKAEYRNDGSKGWTYGEDFGSMQVQVDGVWYEVPDAGRPNSSSGGSGTVNTLISLGYSLEPGDTLDASFGISPQLPNGHYRRIWNRVAVEFDIDR